MRRLLFITLAFTYLVSCDFLLSESELLKENYSITKIQPVDMFPHTDHVENIVLLKLK